MHKQEWINIRIPESSRLTKKELFEYTTVHYIYDVEIHTDSNGTCYAIAVPREGKMIIYGSPMVSSPEEALQIVIDKIHKEGLEEDTQI